MYGQEKKKMKSKAKKEICPLPERFRKKITLTIHPDHYAFIKNAGFNASRFFDTAINALKTRSTHETILITTNTPLKTEKNEGEESRRRELNPRPADYESAAMPG